MTTHPMLSIEDRLDAMNTALQGTLGDSRIMELVAESGYDDVELQAGVVIYEAARDANAAQKAAAGVQHAVTEQKGEAWEDAVDAYQDVAKVIRARFQDDSQKLKLFSLIKQPTDIAGFLANAHNVFNVAMNNADVQEGLLKRKLTPEKLQEKYAFIVALDEANQDQRGAIGDAQLATEAQDIALDQMHKWYAEYIKICRVALEDESQLLEKLGIPARTTRTKAQAAALRKRRETGEEEPMGC